MGAAEIPIRWATGPEELQGAVRVREQVFCVEQGVPRADELDGLDDEALHLVALAPEESRIIATLRLLFSGSRARVGRVAVERDWRRQGIASRMLEEAVGTARARGCTEARLAAQVQATGIYERAGFVIESDPFEQAGIAHVWMGCRLAADVEDVVERHV
jgi:putative N-acetyltransferase (TIGR04045 family)